MMPQIPRPWRWPFALLLCVIFLVGLVVGATTVRNYERNAQIAQAEKRLDLEAKIIALIVERNPEARIRDFAGWPGVLLRLSQDAGIDFAIVLALIDLESGFRPDKIGAAGEVGFMQILPSTMASLCDDLKLTCVPPRGRELRTLGDPQANLRLGIEYLRRMKQRFSQAGEITPAVLRAYNRHPDRALEHRPHDRYAETIGLRLVALVGKVR